MQEIQDVRLSLISRRVCQWFNNIAIYCSTVHEKGMRLPNVLTDRTLSKQTKVLRFWYVLLVFSNIRHALILQFTLEFFG